MEKKKEEERAERGEMDRETRPLVEGVSGTWGRGLGKVPLKKGWETVWRIQLKSTNPTPSRCPPVGWCDSPLQLGLALMVQGKEMDCWGASGVGGWQGAHGRRQRVWEIEDADKRWLKPWPRGPSSVGKEMKAAGGWWTSRTEGSREERSHWGPAGDKLDGVWELASFANASLCMGVISYVAVRALPWVHFND